MPSGPQALLLGYIRISDSTFSSVILNDHSSLNWEMKALVFGESQSSKVETK